MGSVAPLISRFLIVAIALISTGEYLVWSRADWLASEFQADSVRQAIRIEPKNSDFLARLYDYRNPGQDISWLTTEELHRAVQADPLNGYLLIELGLHEELAGHDKEAEADLIRATEVDHQFGPAWVLASYYFRTNQPAEKAWPYLERCLHLHLGFIGHAPTPVFDLAWTFSQDAKKIQQLVPAHGTVAREYLNYLISTDRLDAAIGAWPSALAPDPLSPADPNQLTAFVDYLIRNNRTDAAVADWNQLVKSGILASGALDLATGKSIADPDFSFPVNAAGFGWRLGRANGIFAASFPSEVKIELDGNEPEPFTLLSTLAPLIPQRAYRLTAKLDGSGLKNPQDPGFTIKVSDLKGAPIADCPILRATSCDVTVPPKIPIVKLELVYTRAEGTVRAQGTLRIQNINMSFAK